MIGHKEAHLRRICSRFLKFLYKTAGYTYHRETLLGGCVLTSDGNIFICLLGKYFRLHTYTPCSCSQKVSSVVHIGEIQHPVFRRRRRTWSGPEYFNISFFVLFGTFQAVEECFDTCDHTRICGMFINFKMKERLAFQFFGNIMPYK